MSMYFPHYPFSLPPLPYPYDSLEPEISAETLHFHHDKHFKAYVDNLNRALEAYPAFHSWSLYRLLAQNESLPRAIRLEVRRNAGGVYNHQLYFVCMGPEREGPTESVTRMLNQRFHSVEGWKDGMKQAALSVFGSGWAWLAVNSCGRPCLITTQNQDTPIPQGYTPLLLTDVWEHAYYLQYQNRRADYLDAWFRVVRWQVAEQFLNGNLQPFFKTSD